MILIQNEVLDDKATKNIQSGNQAGSGRIGGGTWLQLCSSECPLFPIAVIRTVGNCRKLGAAFGGKADAIGDAEKIAEGQKD